MARSLVNGSTELEVVEHVMLQNMWEYYVTEMPDESGIGWALVVGDVTEYGTIDQQAIDNYSSSRTNKLDDLLPAPNWYWKNA